MRKQVVLHLDNCLGFGFFCLRRANFAFRDIFGKKLIYASDTQFNEDSNHGNCLTWYRLLCIINGDIFTV